MGTRNWMFAVLFWGCLGTLIPVSAQIVNQAPGTSLGIDSQNPTDFPTFRSQAFDDFTIAAPTFITTFTAYGFDLKYDSGTMTYIPDPSLPTNTGVNAGIYTTPNATTAPILSTTGSEDASRNLNFNFGGALLAPGTYWVSAWVDRPYGATTSRWLWRTYTPVSGSQAIWHNPLNGWGQGGSPQNVGPLVGAGSVDLAYTLNGFTAASVPEPSTFVLAGALVLVGTGYGTWRARKRRALKT